MFLLIGIKILFLTLANKTMAVQIEQYIKDLLFRNDLVIIPGLGAFVGSYKPVSINNETDILLPPSKEITFNSQIKNNDRLLSGYLSQTEGLSSFDASKKVEEFREKIQYSLEKGEEVIFEGLGTLKLQDDGNILFSPSFSTNFLLDSYGLSPVGFHPEGANNNKKEKKAPPQKPKKEKGKNIWLLFFFIPVIVLAIFIYLNIYNNGQAVPPQNKKPEVTESNTPEATQGQIAGIDSSKTGSIVTDSITVAGNEPIQEAKPLQDTVITPDINYYLIGGSFYEQENANKFFNQVQRFGFKPIHLGKQGNYFTVAIGGYATLEQAQAGKNKFIDWKPNSGVYIIKAE